MVDNKKELREKLTELKKQIKANAKDAHWAENALREYESLVGQLKHEPIVLDCGKEVDEWAGETFRITKTTTGVLFHTYGGYSVFCTSNITSLYETLVNYVEKKDEYAKLEGEAKEIHELSLSALAYCINLPSFVCSDEAFLYDTAGHIVKYLREMQEQLLNAPLREETEEDLQANEEFRQATLATKDLVDEISKEVEDIKSKQ
jgi:hypothetical protein